MGFSISVLKISSRCLEYFRRILLSQNNNYYQFYNNIFLIICQVTNYAKNIINIILFDKILTFWYILV